MTNSRVAFLTDVEGNFDYFHRFIKLSKALRWKTLEKEELLLIDGYEFVYGGDVMDKGIGSLRIMKCILALKKSYPQRVHLLLGNRDINKIRFTSELHPAALHLSSYDSTHGPFWLPPAAQISPIQYLETHNLENNIANRLRWMLDCTMGSTDDFERRRKELKILENNEVNEQISDEAVVNSYLQSVQPHGLLREYLSAAQMAIIIHDTLFIHGGVAGYYGGIRKSCVGAIPRGNVGTNEMSITEWVHRLNAFAAEEIEDWISAPQWTRDRTRGGEELLKYVVPTDFPSVIMGRHLLPSGMPFALSREESKRFVSEGIWKRVVGHTPHGNCPSVVNTKLGHAEGCKCFRVIMADTSFSDVKARDNRGKAVSEVLIGDGEEFQVSGMLEDGTTWIEYDHKDEYIGSELRNGYFVKGKLKNEKEYLICKVENQFQYSYHKLHESELRTLL